MASGKTLVALALIFAIAAPLLVAAQDQKQNGGESPAQSPNAATPKNGNQNAQSPSSAQSPTNGGSSASSPQTDSSAASPTAAEDAPPSPTTADEAVAPAPSSASVNAFSAAAGVAAIAGFSVFFY